MNFDVQVNKREFKAYAESNSFPGMFYLVETDEVGGLTCTCKGFMNRATCKHVKAAEKELGLI